MGLFSEWLERKKLTEGRPANWSPAARIGNDPLTSAVEKIQRNLGQMPFDANFTGPDAVQTTFGLDGEELAALQQINLLARGQYGYNIDKNRFAAVFQSLRGRTPNTTYTHKTAGGVNVPPPPPGA